MQCFPAPPGGRCDPCGKLRLAVVTGSRPGQVRLRTPEGKDIGWADFSPPFFPIPGQTVAYTGKKVVTPGAFKRPEPPPEPPDDAPFVKPLKVPPFAFRPREVAFGTDALQTFETTTTPKYLASGTISFTVAPGTGDWNRLGGYRDVNGLVQPTSDALLADGTLAENSTDYTPTAALSEALLTRTVPSAWMPYSCGVDGTGRFARAAVFKFAHLAGEPGNWPACTMHGPLPFPTDGEGNFYDWYKTAYNRRGDLEGGNLVLRYGLSSVGVPVEDRQSISLTTPVSVTNVGAPWGKFRPDGSFTSEGSLGQWQAEYSVAGAAGFLPAWTYGGKVIHPDWDYQQGIVCQVSWVWNPDNVGDPDADGVLSILVHEPQPALIGEASDFNEDITSDPDSYPTKVNAYWHLVRPYGVSEAPSGWQYGHQGLDTGQGIPFVTRIPPPWVEVGNYEATGVQGHTFAGVPTAGIVYHGWTEEIGGNRNGHTIYWWPGAGTIKAFEPAWHASQYGFYLDGSKEPGRCRMAELDDYYGTVPLNVYTGDYGTLPTPYSGLTGAWCGISFSASGRYAATALTSGASLYGLLLTEDGTLSVSLDGVPAWSGPLSLLHGDAAPSDAPTFIENGPQWLHPDFPESFARVGNCVLRPLAVGDKPGRAYSSTLTSAPPVVIALVES